MRENVLQCIHETHLGINKMKAREMVYWPNLNIVIERYIKLIWWSMIIIKNG